MDFTSYVRVVTNGFEQGARRNIFGFLHGRFGPAKFFVTLGTKPLPTGGSGQSQKSP
jgi:hypothetical protein